MSSICKAIGLISPFVLLFSGAPLTQASNISYGAYVSGAYYDGGTAIGSFATAGGFNYNNQLANQASTVADPAAPYSYAVTGANLAPTDLSMELSGSLGGNTAGTAEIWDTLTLRNQPTGLSVNTTLGYLNLTVTAAIGSSKYGPQGNSAYGLQLYDTTLFGPALYANGSPVLDDGDCGVVDAACQGFIASKTSGGEIQSANGGISAPLTLGTYTYSLPITLAELQSGQISYIAEIAAQNSTFGTGTATQLTIDPSITLTDLYPGITVQSASGYNYASPVPLPPAAWLLLSGLAAAGFMTSRRRSGLGAGADVRHA